MTLKKRLRTGAGIPVVMFLTFAVVSYFQIRWIGRSITQLTDVEAPKNEAASRMEIGLTGSGFELMKYLHDHDPVRIERIQRYKEDFREHQSVYCQLATTAEAELSAVALDRNSALLGKATEELINLESYQIQRLMLLYKNFGEIDEILNEGFRVHSESGEQNDYKKLNTIMRMKNKADEVRSSLNSYLRHYKEQDKRKMLEAHRELGILVDTYKDLHAVSEHKQWFERFNGVHSKSMVYIKEIIALDESKRARLAEFVAAKEKLRFILGRNLERTNASFEDAKQAGYRSVGISAIVTLLLIFIGMAASLISQAYISWSVTLPITELRDAADKISQGYYNTKIEVRSDDELGQLAESIGKLAEELKKHNGLSGTSGGEEVEREVAEVST